ncbi:MAG: hypothetical protein MZW92_43655 [Comamonadaceae bacterium]|nr:hypothetical protein [Comamonadaceae bacterium]
MREVGWFFFPLLLNVQMMSISHSVINAALAGMADAVTALAAFSVAMVLHIFVASPSYQNHIITIAMVRGRQSFRATAWFILLTSTLIAALLALLAFTPFGSFVLDHLLGVAPPVAGAARTALAIMVPLPFITGVRGFCQGLASQTRRTGSISFATGVRVGALFLFLYGGLRPVRRPGTRRHRPGRLRHRRDRPDHLLCLADLPHPGTGRGRAGSRRGHALCPPRRFYSPGLQQAVPLLINAIIGRLPDGTLALAAFGIIRGFIFLLASPDAQPAAGLLLALARRADDYLVIARFAERVSLILALLTLAVAGPLCTRSLAP